MLDSSKQHDRPDETPEVRAFRATAKACFLAGESYRELKDILATEDELTPDEMRHRDPRDEGTFAEQLARYRAGNVRED